MDKKKIGEIIKTEREKRNLTQCELGIELGQTEESAQTRISKIEKGLLTPNIDELIKLSLLFDISTDYLLGMSGRKNNSTQITVSDAFRSLFELEKLGLSIHIEARKEIEPHPYTGDPYTVNIEDVMIIFNNKQIDNKLKEWKAVKETCEGESKGDVYKKLYKVWKNDILKDDTLLWEDTRQILNDVFGDEPPLN